MSELLPEDDALLRDARLGLEPTSEDQARIKRALFAQLGVAVGGAALTASKAPVGSTSAAGAKASSIALSTKLLGAALLVGVVGTGVVVARNSHHASVATSVAPSPASSSENASSAASASPATSVFEMDDTPPIASTMTAHSSNAVNSSVLRAAPKSSSSAMATPTTSGPATVSAEAQLLRDARAALRSGDPALALTVLDEHAASFPNGVLSEEREAERVSALCALGRISDAKKVAAVFLRDHAGSPLANGVRASCIAQ